MGLAASETPGMNSELNEAIDRLDDPHANDPLSKPTASSPNNAQTALCGTFMSSNACPGAYDDVGRKLNKECHWEYPAANSCTAAFPEGKPKLVCGPRFTKPH